ncbi:hypothetical protein DK419_01010 [Methylobacterium terrae]|uniref:DUF6894 domain-containing protein n=1 Tax=Methylobacterium terrae TaxID=2202827 RepID=A0A2U8WFS9_9HYPH|nr:hypothetical protein [Methylobacterium terrae]AWN45084.1 hypothetical protein DK419_01010 [Methylobacterium terrae]
MPLYYIDTFDGTAILDDEGTELADLDAARDHVRVVLTKLMGEEAGIDERSRCRADVRDASGRRVLEASLVLTVNSCP